MWDREQEKGAETKRNKETRDWEARIEREHSPVQRVKKDMESERKMRERDSQYRFIKTRKGEERVRQWTKGQQTQTHRETKEDRETNTKDRNGHSMIVI